MLIGTTQKRTKDATAEPVTLDEAKAFLRYTFATDQDALISALIKAARIKAEDFEHRAYLEQTWQYALDGPPDRRSIWLPRPPLRSVTFVQSYSTLDVVTTMNTADYSVDTMSEPGRVVLKAGASWPTELLDWNAIIIEFKAGYGLPNELVKVPDTTKLAIKRAVATWFEHREDMIADEHFTARLELPANAAMLLSLPPPMLPGLRRSALRDVDALTG